MQILFGKFKSVYSIVFRGFRIVFNRGGFEKIGGE